MAGKVRNLCERNGRYYARLVVPEKLRPYLKKTELRTPLGGDRRTAVKKLPGAVANLQYKIGLAEREEARTEGETNPRYRMSIAEIAQRHYQSSIDFDQEIRQHDHRFAEMGADLDFANRLRDGMSGKLSDRELHELVGDRIWRLQTAGNVDAEFGSVEWRTLAQALCVASYEAMERQYERNKGDFTGTPSHPLLVRAAISDERVTGTTFKSIIDTEVARRARGKNAKPLPQSTIKKYRQAVADFIAFRSSDDASTVTAGEGRAWIEAMQEAGHLHNRTVKQKFQNVRTLLNWGRENDPENFLPTGNPLLGLKTPDYTTVPSHQRAYTIDEAKRVLVAARKEEVAMLRWVPWLCAYSGMRVGEAGNLEREDFFRVDGRWFWRVTSSGGRTLKTSGSERRIPVHRALLGEGLIEFVESIPEGRLFRGKTRYKIEVQQRVGEWVRRLITIEDRPDLSPNHGWRHLFEDLCRRDGVPGDARNYITGRTDGHSSELYGKSEVMLPGLADAMDKIKPISW